MRVAKIGWKDSGGDSISCDMDEKVRKHFLQKILFFLDRKSSGGRNKLEQFP